MPHSEVDKLSPRILFLDAYDSFSNNIVSLVIDLIEGADVTVVKIDDPLYLNNEARFHALLKSFDAVICGPGPGSPTIASDIGLIGKLWHLDASLTLPVLGICLGFQSLCCNYGATITRLSNPRHGIVGEIDHNQDTLFKGADKVLATQYNSLHIKLNHDAQERGTGDLWTPSAQCPELKPIAWITGDPGNGLVLHGVRHLTKPFYGVQYHPESICTEKAGQNIIANWWDEVLKWKKVNNVAPITNTLPIRSAELVNPSSSAKTNSMFTPPSGKVEWTSIPFKMLQPADLCEALKINGTEFMLMESGTTPQGTPVNDHTGRYSIIGCMIANETEHLQYHVATRKLCRFTSSEGFASEQFIPDVWGYMKTYMEHRKADGGAKDSPFWGGLVGFASYEAGLDTIDIVPNPAKGSNRPDICFAFIERSIVMDHLDKKIYLQTIRPNDSVWLSDTSYIVKSASARAPAIAQKSEAAVDLAHSKTSTDYSFGKSLKVSLPEADKYCPKVEECKENIRNGDSYELCLTGLTEIDVPTRPEYTPLLNWTIYRRLRDLNPAPFAAYMHMMCRDNRVSILSSSPERFLGWSREGHCSFRPIKGTVKKVPGLTKETAEGILNSSKERAENLMIVDLIRHDLHSVIGHGNVTVEKLMGIEEYETVFQLVSVIEGTIPDGIGKNGVDVLAKSLPPGSMTGAPKKRSCEILQGIEDQVPRGIYSGVLGYMDVGGGGDFSVVIRTAYKWDNDTIKVDGKDFDHWFIGAGGAVTIQSTPEGEYEEMETKRDAWLQTFDGFE